jgi:protein associated with RNAse G/E
MAGANVVQVVENTNRTWSTNGFLFCFFPLNEFWNAFITKNFDTYRIYINIASPVHIDEYSINYIDLEIDIKIDSVKKMDFQVVDINEYLNKKFEHNFPPELDSKVMQTISDLCKEIINIEKSEFYDTIDMLQEKLKFISSK